MTAKEFLEKVMSGEDQELTKAVCQCKSSQDALKLAASYGVDTTEEELAKIAAELRKLSGDGPGDEKLAPEALEYISGGQEWYDVFIP